MTTAWNTTELCIHI